MKMTAYGRPLEIRNLFRSYRNLGMMIEIEYFMRLDNSKLLVNYYLT